MRLVSIPVTLIVMIVVVVVVVFFTVSTGVSPNAHVDPTLHDSLYRHVLNRRRPCSASLFRVHTNPLERCSSSCRSDRLQQAAAASTGSLGAAAHRGYSHQERPRRRCSLTSRRSRWHGRRRCGLTSRWSRWHGWWRCSLSSRRKRWHGRWCRRCVCWCWHGWCPPVEPGRRWGREVSVEPVVVIISRLVRQNFRQNRKSPGFFKRLQDVSWSYVDGALDTLGRAVC
jgi:hypothetical protein